MRVKEVQLIPALVITTAVPAQQSSYCITQGLSWYRSAVPVV